VAGSVLGLALLAASVARERRPRREPSLEAVGAWVAVSVAAAGLAAGPLGRVLAGGAGLGIAAGTCCSAGDVSTKAAVHGGTSLVFVPVLLACHGLGFVALQLGFQRGRALTTAGLATLLTNALPIVAERRSTGKASARSQRSAWPPSPAPSSARRFSRGRRRKSAATPGALPAGSREVRFD
jgi:hypothetical protein